ncbi:MAG: polysaccharide biosynthesis tyrosine autokinase, partial [Lachnospira sp.]|nr:polysaccharide biosynthesis tyrosine autokinase [Lachnospira sp.]
MQEFVVKQSNLDFRTSEAYKMLRTNIEFSGDSNKVIFLTSSTPSEGKSTVSFELALSFAQNGMKTLLIDADLRKSVMKARGRKGKIRYGLTHYLSGKNEFKDVLCVSDVPNFCMVFAGPVPPNPSELVGNDRFKKMIDDAREAFDIVIIDTPPIGSVIDAAVISKFCDGGILVIGCGDISYKFAKKSKEQLEMADCKILGCVLNKVDMTGNSYYGKYYG